MIRNGDYKNRLAPQGEGKRPVTSGQSSVVSGGKAGGKPESKTGGGLETFTAPLSHRAII